MSGYCSGGGAENRCFVFLTLVPSRASQSTAVAAAVVAGYALCCGYLDLTREPQSGCMDGWLALFPERKIDDDEKERKEGKKH